ncbi:unnamed protein product, partial [Nesidiocoris tenuis]
EPLGRAASARRSPSTTSWSVHGPRGDGRLDRASQRAAAAFPSAEAARRANIFKSIYSNK